MRKKKKKKKAAVEEKFEQIEESLSKSEQFIEKNQNAIMYAVLAIVLLIFGIYATKRFYMEPKAEEAKSSIFMAQEKFAIDSFQLALNGQEGVFEGFAKIADQYSTTASGNLAKYYAGICYKNLGQYEEAIDYLNDFDADDFLLSSMAISTTADCYFQLEKYEKAADLYQKASKLNPNSFSSPIFLYRAGIAYEKLEKWKEALKMYKELEIKYPFSMEGREVQKYITRVEMAQKA